MKLIVFDRQKYMKSLRQLEDVRKAPTYVIHAYRDGHTSTVNEYYKIKLEKRIHKNIELQNENVDTLSRLVTWFDIDFLNEAISNNDLAFIKAFFKMANLDLISGNRLPPNASALIKQGIAKDIDLNKLFKKLR